MSAPPFVPVPSQAIRTKLAPSDWEEGLTLWNMLIEAQLALSDDDFARTATAEAIAATISPFLTSYLNEAPSLTPSARARTLRRLVFLYTKRLLLASPASKPDQAADSSLFRWRFIAAFLQVYGSCRAARTLLPRLWAERRAQMTACVEEAKSTCIRQLSGLQWSQRTQQGRGRDATGLGPTADLRMLSLLSCLVPEIGQLLLTGSDYIDALQEAYARGDSAQHDGIVANTYVGFCSLLNAQPPVLSQLLDQLYAMHAAAKAASKPGTETPVRAPTLLSALICSTDLLDRLEEALDDGKHTRGRDLLRSLGEYEAQCQHLHRPAPFMPRADNDKGKGAAKGRPASPSQAAALEESRRIHIGEVKELFPDMDDAYVGRLLRHYGDDVETVVAHLLDGSVAPELADEEHPVTAPEARTQPPAPAPHATPVVP
ncbi:hypothetical protein KEM52_004773, partial [Ascosphaera acerosa]